jgi:hypothetical protein
MNNEQQQIIDKAYENYTNSLFYDFSGDVKGYRLHEHLSQEEFINKCKTDTEFSEKWGLKIEEQELSWEERETYGYEINIDGILTEEWADKLRLPTKLITITYNNERIESYE